MIAYFDPVKSDTMIVFLYISKRTLNMKLEVSRSLTILMFGWSENKNIHANTIIFLN